MLSLVSWDSTCYLLCAQFINCWEIVFLFFYWRVDCCLYIYVWHMQQGYTVSALFLLYFRDDKKVYCKYQLRFHYFEKIKIHLIFQYFQWNTSNLPVYFHGFKLLFSWNLTSLSIPSVRSIYIYTIYYWNKIK